MSLLYIVIPAYDEEANIEQCVNDWYKIINEIGDEQSRLIIIDDGSKDSTFERLKALSGNRPKLIPLTKENGGHGSAVLFGYRYAIENGAEWIFQTDSDGQTNPDEFEEFWKETKNYDVILGNRVVRGDGKGRKFVENMVCFLLRIIFRVKVQDANAPFRLMRTSVVNKYINNLPADFNIPNIMFTTYFVFFKEKVLFIPISFKAREKGKNSIDPRKIMKIGWKAIRDFRKLKKEMGTV